MFRMNYRLGLLLCSTSMMGCSGGSGVDCKIDEDCESNFCKADGTCGPADENDAGTGSDAAPDGNADLCTPNHDDSVGLAELPLRAGKMANFRIATNPTFNTAGAAAGGGARTWDLTGALTADADTTITLAAPTGAYWAADFPGATYAAPLAASSNLLGVFSVDASAVTLLGVVSPTAGTFGTKLTYNPPAIILQLPLTANKQWASSSNVTGTYMGAVANYTENYDAIVDAVGTMKTPYGEFPVIRVATDLAQQQLGATYASRRSFAWIAECFGSIANVSSKNLEASSEFDDPAEVRRLAP